MLPLTAAVEPDDGESRLVRLGSELKMVHEDQHYFIFKQGRSFQAEARPLSIRELFPRLLRWQRRQSGSEIPVMAVQPSQPRASQFISSVSPSFRLRLLCPSANACKSLTQATDTSNIRLVFAAVKDTILHNALADSGIL